MEIQNNQDPYFSSENQKALNEVITLIQNSQDSIKEQQIKHNFKKFIGQEIYWMLSTWLEFIMHQNYTHINQNHENAIKNLLNDMNVEFQAIEVLIKKLNLDRPSTYVPQIETINGISQCFKKVLDKAFEQDFTQLLKLNYQKDQYQHFLCLKSYEESELAKIDTLFKEGEEIYEAVMQTKDVFKVDIAYFMITPLFSKIEALEVDDFYEHFEAYCKDNGINLNKEQHLQKLEFYMDFENRGRIKKEEIDDFFTFIWCNPLQRYQFINDPGFKVDESKPNTIKLLLSLQKRSKENETSFPKMIYIDQYGYWITNKGREKIRKPVRFGRKAQNNIIPCDIYFGQKEITISKRQFVIKPDYNEYYAYCISTTNPTEFLVQTDGAYITKDSAITFNDKVCLVVTECVVKGEEENGNIQIVHDDLEDGPTQRRGKKYNPAIQELQEKEKNLQKIANNQDQGHKQPNDEAIVDEDDEITIKEEHKSYEKKKQGMNDMKQYFQMRINNDSPLQIQKENGEKYINKQYENHSVHKPIDNRIIPNREIIFNDTKKKDQCYLQFRVEFCELECEEKLTQVIEKFNETIKKENKQQFFAGYARGSAIWIDDPSIKEFQAYFMYNETENRWMVHDYSQHIMSQAVHKNQYTTVAFKGVEETNHSALFKLQRGSTIVVSGNFLEVDYSDIDLNKIDQ